MGTITKLLFISFLVHRHEDVAQRFATGMELVK